MIFLSLSMKPLMSNREVRLECGNGILHYAKIRNPGKMQNVTSSLSYSFSDSYLHIVNMMPRPHLCPIFCLVVAIQSDRVYTSGFEAPANQVSSTLNVDSRISSLSSFKLRSPDFIHPRRDWVNVGKAISDFNEAEARLGVQLNAKPDMSDALDSRSFETTMRHDVSRANELDKEVQTLNAEIQAEPIRDHRQEDIPYSLIERGHTESFVTSEELLTSNVVLSDWAYCMCKSGDDGILVNPERNWPGVALATAPTVSIRPLTSLLQVTVGGRRMSIRRADKCNCEDPWEGVHDPSGSSKCSVTNGATICLVRVNTKNGKKSPEGLRMEADQLIGAIDEAFTTKKKAETPDRLLGNGTKASSFVDESSKPNSFVETWRPFRFQ